ncbi:hypothetical protein [Mycobacteroides abscessus]|uniref:hypothetical protein n=1 Tax=Mycobacteroides abscessus TaxID=36809 RepID=UPI0019D11D1E|nr:hypothetical protein [Mycobacteroides abscessus]MBN7411169.1 hypothetical protein [Mycobacteroides abscessus subsp. abscessus]
MSDLEEPIRARQRWRVPVEDPYTALAGIIAYAPRLPGALCRGKSEIFDVEDATDPRAQQALELCARCPALAACAAWIDGLPPTLRPAGVVAGRLPTTPLKKRARGPSPTAVENVAVRGRQGQELQQRRRTPA